MITNCTCGWKLPADGMKGSVRSKAPIPTDLAIVLTFSCPDCGEPWETELMLVYSGPADAPRPEPS